LWSGSEGEHPDGNAAACSEMAESERLTGSGLHGYDISIGRSPGPFGDRAAENPRVAAAKGSVFLLSKVGDGWLHGRKVRGQ
jgi:hypothetical protein